jgi:hypothetical protein
VQPKFFSFATKIALEMKVKGTETLKMYEQINNKCLDKME